MNTLVIKLQDLGNRLLASITPGKVIAALVAAHFLAHSYIWWSVS